MKNLKKVFSLLLAMAMVMVMVLPVSAAEDDLEGHTYKAYQIFSGTQTTEEGDATLADVKWGTGVNEESLLKELQKNTAFAECTTAADVAEVLSTYKDKSAEAKAFAKLAYKFKEGTGVEVGTELSAGYYLVVDETAAEVAEVYNLALLQLTKKGEFTNENKTDVPELTKKVDDENDSVVDDDENDIDGEDDANWQDSADYDIGDNVPFQLTGTVADNYDDYDTYYFAFHDVEEIGLTFNNDVVVKVDGEEITSGYKVVTKCEDKCTFEVVFENLKEIEEVGAGSVITVEYTSKLNENAKIGNEGNVNKAFLEFSNNPNDVQEGKPSTGKTPEDSVIVFTYKVVVNKVDPKGDELPGATFELQKFDAKTNTWSVAQTVNTKTDTVFTFSGLDAGKYKLVETDAPAGYNQIKDVEFTVTASHKIEWDGTNKTAVLTELSGNATSGEITFTSLTSEGSLTTNVVNQKGTTLPETGGMGTTMFYVIGAILVVGAVVVMITRKRMSK